MSFAVIPAAGQSVRMGRPKLLLPLRGRPVVEHTVAAFRTGGVQHVLVVVGPDLPELARLATAVGAEAIQLDENTPDMRTTVQRGLDWLEEQYHPTPEDGWFLAPADCPALESQVIRTLLDARVVPSTATIVVPTFEGRRGHPVWLAWGHVAGIRAWPVGEGLNTYVRAHASETLEVPVGSSGILADLDTPEDYERLRGGQST